MAAEKSVLKIRTLRVLGGKQAVQALAEYIEELREQRDGALTDTQSAVMVKVAQGLIASFEREPRLRGLPRAIAARYRLAPVFREYEVPLSYATA